MFNAAELYKSYRLNISAHRLVITPFIMLAIYCIAFIRSHQPLATLSHVSLSFYTLFVVFYGALCASSSFTQELRQKTWDNIRLSSLSIRDLLFGKLFGMTLYAWYGGAIALVVLMLSLLLQGALFQHLTDLLLMLIAGVFVHVVAMIIDLQSLQLSNVSRTGFANIALLIFAIIYSSMFLMGTAFMGIMSAFDKVDVLWGNTFTWYQTEWNVRHFIVSSSIVFLAWMLLGVYRQLRELIFCKSLLPWAWTGFVLFLIFYFNGFIFKASFYNDYPIARFANALLVSAASAYAIISYKTHSVTHYRLLKKYFQTSQWSRFAEGIPLWSISYVLCVFSAIFVMLNLPESVSINADTSFNVPVVSGSVPFQTSFNAFVIGVLLFVLRDILLILYFSFSPKAKRSLFMATVYLLILYILLPTLLTTIGLSNLAWYLFPPINAGSYLTLLPALGQVVLVLWLLRKRVNAVD